MSHSSVQLTSRDGSTLSAYIARPEGKAKGAVVVIQEIFGVNSHIRSVADRFATEGYLAIAPALFDRIQQGVELGYSGDDMSQALALMGRLSIDSVLEDTQAAIDYLHEEGMKSVAIVGFCYGGSIAWLAASRLAGVSTAIGYYGGLITQYINEQPKVPVMLHFGEKDDHIPMEGVNQVAAAHPDVDVFVYSADHGFNCDQRGSYDAVSAALAWKRTITMLEENLR